MYRIPKGLLDLEIKYPGIIEEVWNEGKDGYWINLEPGYIDERAGIHMVHEETVRECVRTMKTIVPCTPDNCSDSDHIMVHQPST
jgi:hypothetical protein